MLSESQIFRDDEIDVAYFDVIRVAMLLMLFDGKETTLDEV